MFIRLTDNRGTTVYVNTSFIVAFSARNGRTTLVMADKAEKQEVVESPDEILRQIPPTGH